VRNACTDSAGWNVHPADTRAELQKVEQNPHRENLQHFRGPAHGCGEVSIDLVSNLRISIHERSIRAALRHTLHRHMRGPAHTTKDKAMQALGLVWGHIDPVAANLEEVRTEIAQPTHYGARQLLDHWHTREARGGFVVGRDVPAREIASILRNLALFEPMDDGADFRVRLAGAVYMRRFGRDITGLKLSQIYDAPNFEWQRENLDAVTRAQAPSVVDVKLARGDRVFLRFEGVRMRALSPDRRDIWVMGGIFCSDLA